MWRENGIQQCTGQMGHNKVESKLFAIKGNLHFNLMHYRSAVTNCQGAIYLHSRYYKGTKKGHGIPSLRFLSWFISYFEGARMYTSKHLYQFYESTSHPICQENPVSAFF